MRLGTTYSMSPTSVPHNRSRLREQGFGGQRLRRGPGQAEINNPRHGLPVHFAYQNVGWFLFVARQRFECVAQFRVAATGLAQEIVPLARVPLQRAAVQLLQPVFAFEKYREMRGTLAASTMFGRSARPPIGLIRRQSRPLRLFFLWPTA